VSRFATIDDPRRPIRILQVGAGGMGRAWLRNISGNADAELVGIVDLDLDGAARAAAELGYGELPLGRSVTELAAETRADAVLNVTIPVAHHPVSTEALFLGLPVLSEKPGAPTVAEALSLAAASEVTGQLLMISQSRRYYRNLSAYKSALRDMGAVGLLTNQFFKAPHFGGFREAMAYPLLVDMAIHPFDVARFLLDDDPVAVYADSFNPSWSWFGGDAGAAVTFEFESGMRFQYTGSWVSGGHETSWNGSWLASTEQGTVTWDGEGEPTLTSVGGTPTAVAASGDEPEEIAGSLAEFVSALRTGVRPSGEVHENIGSLAMVEAAVLSATRRERVLLADVLAAARSQAVTAEQRPDVRERLSRAAVVSGG
jgi:predicted dehydrogenase